MPRPRYPSDDQRARIKPHARVHLSVKNHAKTVDVWADPEQRGMLTEIWRLASERGAAHTGDWLHLNRDDVRFISGRAQYVHAERAVRALCVRVEYATRARGACFSIQVRNYAKKQNITPRLRRVAPSDSVSSPLPSPHSALKEEDKATAKDAVAFPEPQNGSAFPDEKLLAVLMAASSPTLRQLATPRLAPWWTAILGTFDGIAELYLDEQLKRMDLWLMENPARAKTTLRGAQQFVRNWLQREEPRARAAAAQQARASRPAFGGLKR